MKQMALSLLLLAFVYAAPESLSGEEADQKSRFDSQFAPILSQRCLSCHNPTDRKVGLDLSTEKSALAGGESGKAVVAGHLERTLIWE